MNQHDVAEILVAARVDPIHYSFDSDSRDALCLTHYNGPGWRVYATERGKRLEERHFDDEDAACVYFLKRIFQILPPR